MKGRITFKMRRGGRIYIGMDGESFAALYGLVKLGGAASAVYGRKENYPCRKKVVDAFTAFCASLSLVAAKNSEAA